MTMTGDVLYKKTQKKDTDERLEKRGGWRDALQRLG